jgi:sulfide dehydrogenase cytochrome subunit
MAAKGKDLHMQACEKCHIKGGSVGIDDAAILTGQQMGYLGNAFKEFLSEKRNTHAKMKVLLDEQNKANIESLINYYASFK